MKYLGLDIGSTTVKLIIKDSGPGEVLYSRYRRHNAAQISAAREALLEAARLFSGSFFISVCGSGGYPVAKALNALFIQEVLASAAAIVKLYPTARTVIELGGQDAKVIYFKDGAVTDMRMNGSCAGGTGAFIDEIAALLNVAPEDFNALAHEGELVYDISGRCGVFAKTDIQPLLIQGAKKQDIAISALHAIAKQTIGGLSQGLIMQGPIVFEGGPFNFNPALIRVFAERLNLNENEIIIPKNPETIIAYGAALAAEKSPSGRGITLKEAAEILNDYNLNAADERGLPLSPVRADTPLRQSNKTPLTSDIFIGVDCGSTTSKIVFIDENEDIIDSFYANNNGQSLEVIKKGLLSLYKKYPSVNVKGLGVTGYGELITACALGADIHLVETLAHVAACLKYFPNASFILDIGGQDMKAIWLKDGVITNIMLNEACSSGCGSFLENFAHTLGVNVSDIADAAFSSKNPAALGSRCTVFMNSTIVSEQRKGRTSADICAGLCRAMIENVFTKVIRVSDLSELGDCVVAQGGAFRNMAVLAALREYVGRKVYLAPYPGEMGAIGAALTAKRSVKNKSSFIGFDKLLDLNFTQDTGTKTCAKCENACALTVTRFSSGAVFTTGNRCERGEIANAQARPAAKNLFKLRNELLFKDYAITPVSPQKQITIGIPRALDFFESAPFWGTFFRALGYNVLFSAESSRQLYETGLPYVASDTICFPAKLAHGHIKDLLAKNADLIFMPYMMNMFTKGDKACQVCPVLKGYPMVIRGAHGLTDTFLSPVFHFYTKRDKIKQICLWAVKTLSVTPKEANAAFIQAEKALFLFKNEMRLEGEGVLRRVREVGVASGAVWTPPPTGVLERAHEKGVLERACGEGVFWGRRGGHWPSVVLKRAREEGVFWGRRGGHWPSVVLKRAHEKGVFWGRRGGHWPSVVLKRAHEKGVLERARDKGAFAVLIAGRPYHTDPFILRGLDALFTKQGIPVLTIDSLPGREADISSTRAEVTNTFHAQMIKSVMEAAVTPQLQCAQIISFGCGHDAILSDEVTRIMDLRAGKRPLIIKLDEGEAAGALRIRVQSFIETARIRRDMPYKTPLPLPDAYPAKFHKKDKQTRTLIIPNLSANVSLLLKALLQSEGYTVKTVPIGGMTQIKAGKRAVHNDICFPAQVVIGELLHELKNGAYEPDKTAVVMMKLNCECRLAQYPALLRKALDSEGFENAAIVTNDFKDEKGLSPGLKPFGIQTMIKGAYMFLMLDILEELRRKVRPYEINPGDTDKTFDKCMEDIIAQTENKLIDAKEAFKRAIKAFCEIPYDRSVLKPRVLVTGELLVAAHPGSNFYIENYLEELGMETVFTRVTDQVRKEFLTPIFAVKDFKVKLPRYPLILDKFFDHAQKSLERIASMHPLCENAPRPRDLYAYVKDIFPRTLNCGEGWLMAGEIVHMAAAGTKAFIILQPFGCLPNHICGRGIIKRIKEMFPQINILPLDLDPDTSYANIENRLQMLLGGLYEKTML